MKLLDDGAVLIGAPSPHETALNEIAAERQRQIAKGYDAKHDDAHGHAMLIFNSWGAVDRLYQYRDARSGEKSREWLIEAAAQIVAEIERLDRAKARSK